MRVLVVTQMFPSHEDPLAGIFVRRQLEAIQRIDATVSVDVRVLDVRRGRHVYLTAMFGWWRRLAGARVDLVHVHSGLCLPATAGWRGPRVVTFHGSELEGWRNRCFCRCFVRDSDYLIYVRRSMAFSRKPEERQFFIGCGVDTKLFVGSRRRPVVAKGRVVVGFPSGPERLEKDYALFERTIEVLRRGLRCDVVVLFRMSPESVAERLREMDVLVYTSKHEGSPVLSKEALCCGCRVVGVDVGDLKEQVRGQSGCEIVQGRSPHTLAAAIRSALTEEGPDPQLSRRCFSLDGEARKVLAVYRRAVDEGG